MLATFLIGAKAQVECSGMHRVWNAKVWCPCCQGDTSLAVPLTLKFPDFRRCRGCGAGWAVWAVITNIAIAQHVGLITLAHHTGHSLCGITTYSMLLNSYHLPSHLKRYYYKSNLRKSACKDPFPFSKSAQRWASFGPESHPSSFSSGSLLVVHNVHFRLCTSLSCWINISTFISRVMSAGFTFCE